MERSMERVKVSVNDDGMVVIEQADPLDETAGDYITLHPSQIELVCQWLREARDEAQNAPQRKERPPQR